MEINPHHPVYELVKRIPPGKVLTYGLIAKACRIKSPRFVGFLLHHNPDPDAIPCHRVVNAVGRCAPNFAFGFADAQEQLLKEEGVTFSKSRVNLQKHLFPLPSDP